MPNKPLGSFSNGKTFGWLVGTHASHDRFLIMSADVARRVQRLPPRHYWRFMAGQLSKIGLPDTPYTAWRAFAH